jgi:hypothetical protein
MCARERGDHVNGWSRPVGYLFGLVHEYIALVVKEAISLSIVTGHFFRIFFLFHSSNNWLHSAQNRDQSTFAQDICVKTRKVLAIRVR